MYILGINAYHGDSSACILKNGEVIAASEEERFRRIKHWAGFPSEAIKFCLSEANIDITQVDYITISRDPSANIHKKVFHALKTILTVKSLKARLENSKKVISTKAELSKALNVPEENIKT